MLVRIHRLGKHLAPLFRWNNELFPFGATTPGGAEPCRGRLLRNRFSVRRLWEPRGRGAFWHTRCNEAKYQLGASPIWWKSCSVLELPGSYVKQVGVYGGTAVLQDRGDKEIHGKMVERRAGTHSALSFR